MTSNANNRSGIVRTERGLTIAGTRITLYDVMDYVTAQYPSKFIQGLFELTDAQIGAALNYIEANRAEVETEYRQVLVETDALQQYYEEQNRGRFAKAASQAPVPGTEAAWEKLRAIRATRESRV